MTAAGPNDLARALRAFFADHLPRVRGTSPHTVRSYRDSLVLLLRFVATETQRSVHQLDLDDLGPQPILAFLQHLELDRHNSVATRNVRLTAIHALFRYGRIPDFPVTRSHPPASWPSAANSSICRTYRKTAGEESRRRSPAANRWMRP